MPPPPESTGAGPESGLPFELHQEKADVFVPDGKPFGEALRRTTHLGILSHQDDLEIGAYHGIAECFRSTRRWFSGVVVSDGGGSPRAGAYAHFTDDEMKEVRRTEQRKAAYVGEYGIQIQLAYPSKIIKNPPAPNVVEDIRNILELAQPDYIYLHNPCDRHDTHVATLARCLEAIRSMPVGRRPGKAYGVEVWRKLDWVVDEDKVSLAVDRFPHLAGPLVGVFDSQISGGKRYDLAEEGLRRANATYVNSHSTDTAGLLTFAMDLTPLVRDENLGLEEFAVGYVERLREDVSRRIRRYV